MKKESLERVIEEIVKIIDKLEIDEIDKIEIMMNISKFLDKEEYKENIKILNKERRRSR